MDSPEKKQFELRELNEAFEGGAMKPLNRDKFKFLKLLGTGGFGKVYQVVSSHSGNHYALKVLSKNQIRHYKLEKQLKREVSILHTCNHQYIIELHACFEDSE